MNVKKRIMSIFVAALMVFTMMPMMAGSVYADTEIVVDGLAYRIGPTEDAELIGIDDENGKAINKMTGEMVKIPSIMCGSTILSHRRSKPKAQASKILRAQKRLSRSNGKSSPQR